MKQTIEWHEECLKNLLRDLRNKIENLKKMQSEIQKESKEIYFLESQIVLAKKKKMTSFDARRLGLKRGSKK